MECLSLFIIFHNFKNKINLQLPTLKIQSQPLHVHSLSLIHSSSSCACCLVNCSRHSAAQSSSSFLTRGSWMADLTPELTHFWGLLSKEKFTWGGLLLVNWICILQILPPKSKHFVWLIPIGRSRSLQLHCFAIQSILNSTFLLQNRDIKPCWWCKVISNNEQYCENHMKLFAASPSHCTRSGTAKLERSTSLL